MNAVISGRAGVALFLQGDQLFSLDIDRPEELVPRGPDEYHLLIGEGTDLEFLEEVDPTAVRQRLEHAVCREEALDVSLLLLDGGLADAIRNQAAADLEECFEAPRALDSLEAVLYAAPLPETADLPGAFRCAHNQEQSVRPFLRRLEAHQTAIRMVHQALEALPERSFGGVHERRDALTICLRTGLFRDMARVLAEKGSPRSHVTQVLDICPELGRFRDALTRWGDLLQVQSPDSGPTTTVGTAVASAKDEIRHPEIRLDGWAAAVTTVFPQLKDVARRVWRWLVQKPIRVGVEAILESADMKELILRALFSKWPRLCPLEDGYTILLPSPMDMPFLLRYALEGLAGTDTTNCRQILIVPDASGADGGEALRRVITEFDDPRIALLDLTPFDNLIGRLMGKKGSALHWRAIVAGTARASGEYIFLHDADAFFIEPDALERQYRECREVGLYTLGVTARWDPFFEEAGYAIPGTWEMMYSTRWARSRTPLSLKGRWWPTPHGAYEFDTMLYPQFLDFPTGRIGIMEPPPRLVHFHGTIVTYRIYVNRAGASVKDELFRILLLAMLEELLPAPNGVRLTPAVDTLVRGLDDPSAPVTYNSENAPREYRTFRGLLEDLCSVPIFQGTRAERLRALIRPFDDHFASRAASDAVFAATDPPGTPVRTFRRHGLSEGAAN